MIEEATSLPGRRPVALVVEDDVVLRMSVVEIVERCGVEALAAPNADAAVEALDSRADIRVLITDVNMPGSMDGIDLAHLVRERRSGVKLIVLSGQPISASRPLPIGAVFFAKPCRDEIIANAIVRAIGAGNLATAVQGSTGNTAHRD
jgi:CheY-like chemotaxis protein